MRGAAAEGLRITASILCPEVGHFADVPGYRVLNEESGWFRVRDKVSTVRFLRPYLLPPRFCGAASAFGAALPAGPRCRPPGRSATLWVSDPSERLAESRLGPPVRPRRGGKYPDLASGHLLQWYGR